MRRAFTAVLACLAIAGLLILPASAADGPRLTTRVEVLEAQVADLMARVAALEGGVPSPTATPTPSPSATAAPTPSSSPSPTPSATPVPTATATASPTATPQPSPTSTVLPGSLVLCDGNQNASPIKLDGGVYADPSVLKIIRNCTYDHIVGSHAIVLNGARNVLIEGNTFADIHSGVVGTGQHGIAIRGINLADSIVIRGNTFMDIGADGIQMADGGRNVRNVLVEDNTFTYQGGTRIGGWTGGENAIDVKGVDGPVTLRGNTVIGYLPCDAGDECSGSNGVGVVVHDGDPAGRAHDVLVEGNTFTGSVTGLNVTDADDVSIRSNTFRDQLSIHVRVTSAAVGCTHKGDTFSGTGSVSWGPCVLVP